MQRYALVLVVASLFALPVQGAVTATNTLGHVQVDGQVADPTMTPTTLAEFHQQVNRFDNGLFQQSRYDNIQLPTSQASAMASQTSSFSFAPNGDLIGVSFLGTSAATGANFGTTTSMAMGASFMGVEFLVAGSSVTLTLSGNMARGANDPTVALDEILPASRQRLLSIDPVSLSLPAYQSTGFNWSGVLQPGAYVLYASVVSFGSLPTTTFADSNSLALSATLTTPEPTTVALLVLGGLAVLRRRR